MSDLCKICGEGTLVESVKANLVTYKGVSTFVDSHYSTCNKCESTQVSAEQANANKEIMLKLKKSVDGRHG